MKKIIETKKMTDIDKLYKEKFVNDFTSQSKNIVDIAKWLIGVEIILFNAYLSALIYLAREKILIEYTFISVFTLIMVVLSIIFLMLVILPRKIKVNENILEGGDDYGNIGIKDYFFYSAKVKYIYLSCSLFFLICSLMSILFFIFLNWR